MAAVALLAFVAPIGAQEIDSYAFLLAQPRFRIGLPQLPANTIRHFAAQYDLSGRIIDVSVAPDFPSDGDAAVTTSDSWRVVPCDIPLERSTAGERSSVARAYAGDYDVYMTALEDETMLCRFAVQFTTTFDFFLEALGLRDDTLSGPGAAIGGVVPQFPGVLDLDG